MADILHRLKVYLYDNVLTADDPNDYVARVISEQSLDVKQIAESAATRGGADVSAAAMEHAVNLWLKEMAYRLCDGFSVNTGWFTASTHLKGVFDGPNDRFDPARHTILFEFQQGAELRRQLPSVTVDILGPADVGIQIAQVVDAKTGSVNNVITPRYNLKIAGHKMKIAGDKPGTGVFFISQDDPDAVYTVAPEDIVVNNPSELVIVIPPLIADTYKLQVTTQYSSNSKQLLKEPRTAVFDRILTVQ